MDRHSRFGRCRSAVALSADDRPRACPAGADRGRQSRRGPGGRWRVRADVQGRRPAEAAGTGAGGVRRLERSEEHTSELQSLMRISYAVFCLKKKKTTNSEEYT